MTSGSAIDLGIDPPLPEVKDSSFFEYRSQLPPTDDGETARKLRRKYHYKLRKLRLAFLRVYNEGFKPPKFEILNAWHLFDFDLTNLGEHHRPLYDALLQPQPDQATLQLKFIRPLQSGRDLWGQVWLGEISFTDLSERKPVPFVMKLYLDSLFKEEVWTDREDYSRICGAAQAQREAWAYTSLRNLQGTGPYFILQT